MFLTFDIEIITVYCTNGGMLLMIIVRTFISWLTVNLCSTHCVDDGTVQELFST